MFDFEQIELSLPASVDQFLIVHPVPIIYIKKIIFFSSELLGLLALI